MNDPNHKAAADDQPSMRANALHLSLGGRQTRPHGPHPRRTGPGRPALPGHPFNLQEDGGCSRGLIDLRQFGAVTASVDGAKPDPEGDDAQLWSRAGNPPYGVNLRRMQEPGWTEEDLAEEGTVFDAVAYRRLLANDPGSPDRVKSEEDR